MRNFCHSCKFCTLTISVIKTNPSIDNRFWSTCQKHPRKTSWRCLDVLKTFLQDVLKTSWRRLEDVDVWPGRIYWSWSRRLQDVLKTFSEDAWVRRIYSPWSRRLEDVLKASSEDEDKRRLQDVFIKTNVSWDWRQYSIFFTLNFFRGLLSQG